MLALPWSRLGYPPLCVALPDWEDKVSPRASKLVCCPELKNMGWLSRRSAIGTAVGEEDEDVEEDEELAPPGGGGGGWLLA